MWTADPRSGRLGVGYRYYSPGQVREARLIDALRTAGFPLADIVDLLRDPSGERLDVWSRRVQTDAEQRQETLDMARRLLPLHALSLPPIDYEHSGSISMTHLKTATRTDIGRVRDNNEDAVVTTERLAVVADGMGGHPGGELASAVAISLVEAAFTGRSLDELQAAVRAANRAIWGRARDTADLEGMGTTICAAALITDGDLAVVHVGDSRAYVLHDGVVHQITDDHSLTAELVRRGELSELQALDHPQRGVITRVLGGGPQVEPDGNTHPATVADRLLLCSDGLFNELRDDDITSIMAANESIQATADGLVHLAWSRGGRDNVSVVVAEISA